MGLSAAGWLAGWGGGYGKYLTTHCLEEWFRGIIFFFFLYSLRVREGGRGM